MKDWTYGTELEIGDFFNKIELPPGAVISQKEEHVANSIGIGCDPRGEIYPFGGEINTKPTATVEEQYEHIKDIYSRLKPGMFVNTHWNGLHFHVHIPGLKDNLTLLKRIFKYYHERADYIYDRLYPIMKKDDMPKRIFKTMKKNSTWAVGKMTDKVYERVMSAETPKQFYEYHAHVDKNGRRLFHLVKRAGINLMPVFKETETVEFRVLLGVDTVEKVIDGLELFLDILKEAISDNHSPAEEIVKDKRWDHFVVDKLDYDYEKKMIDIHEFTSIYFIKSRRKMKERINEIRKYINIDDIKNVDINRLHEIVMMIR